MSTSQAFPSFSVNLTDKKVPSRFWNKLWYPSPLTYWKLVVTSSSAVRVGGKFLITCLRCYWVVDNCRIAGGSCSFYTHRLGAFFLTVNLCSLQWRPVKLSFESFNNRLVLLIITAFSLLLSLRVTT